MAYKLTPQEFDSQFVYVKDIGSGTYGTVYQYRELQSNQNWAVKNIKSQNFEDLTSSIQELILLSRATHQHVIQIKYYCMIKEENKLPGGKIQESYNLYLFMELGQYSLDFEILERFKNKHYYSSKSIYFLIYDVGQALYYLQKIKLAHRDIKPHNIVKVNKIYKLTDFGVSKPKQNLNKFSTLMGSPPYLAPNLFQMYNQGQTFGEYNAFKTDSFSFGLVILGCALLEDITSCNAQEKIKNDKIEKLESTKRYGTWLIQILKGLLEYDENNRWDFIQLQQFLKKLQQNPKLYELNLLNTNPNLNQSDKQYSNSSIKIIQKQQQNSQECSPNIAQSKLSELLPTLQFKTLTSDFFEDRVDSLQINKNQDQEEQKQENKSIDNKTMMQEKFVIQEFDEDEEEMLISMNSADTFNWKKQKFLKNVNIRKYGEGQYVGEVCQNKRRNGFGEFLSKEGTFYYKGQWVNDFMEGQGEATWEGGKKYSGQWKNSQRHGDGILSYGNGDIYKGQFNLDVKHGKGEYITHLCEKYIGEYKYGEREGFGTFQYNDNTIYEGQWKSNQKHGFGVLKNIKRENEIIYEGQFRKNKFHGQGKIQLENNFIYEGEFSKGLQNGKGIIYPSSDKSKAEEVEYEKGKLKQICQSQQNNE